MYQSIITEVDDSVGILTLNKAERHNAFDEQLVDEITGGLLDLEADPRVRVVVLSSTGKSFCAGADLNWVRRSATCASIQPSAGLAAKIMISSCASPPRVVAWW